MSLPPVPPPAPEPPFVSARRALLETPWIRVVEKDVRLPGLAAPEPYAILEGRDSAVVCARRADGRLVLIRQWRPAIEAWNWEFPGGEIDPGETPEHAAAREVLEETGHRVDGLVGLGAYPNEVSRCSARGHLFFARAEPVAGWVPEAGVELGLFAPDALEALIADGRFMTIQQVALWLMVKAAGLV